MLCCIPDQLKCSVWVSEIYVLWAKQQEKERIKNGLSQRNFINCLSSHSPIFSFQQPHTKEGSLVSFTRRRQPLSALLSPSPHKPSSPQGGRSSQALTEGASQGAPARARWVGDGVPGAWFPLRTILSRFLSVKTYLGIICQNGLAGASKLVLFVPVRSWGVGICLPSLGEV